MVEAKESILEKVIKEVPNSPHPSPFPIKETPFFEGTWFDIGRRAVEILKDICEIKEFMDKYTQYIHTNYKLSLDEAEKSAKKVVGYCTGYVDDTQANKWFNALPDINHPITGRERPFKGGDNVEIYHIIGKSDDEEIKSYLTRALTEDITGLGFQVLDRSNPIQGRDNQDYFAFRIKPKNTNSLGNTGAYMFLMGYIQGIQSRMKGEIGKSCKLGLEKVNKR